ncbi:hypothetical protein [Gloeobacter kilaueensis]|uniref:Uncharacterized protein n=1 Tax=Gloeobacter kilaueensis (strain ATCC BAA-2537 / CCAP 1431/1 / ULC 316 / JS1) TaxID=1183438 RepID=U5QK57_GLOK1|nr:hypothetical protein [Gloeobacter kilaueensis]AGY58004.1 hypothetical protein GKIL_1758 [Gloeobacter kilaueensis JS1]
MLAKFSRSLMAGIRGLSSRWLAPAALVIAFVFAAIPAMAAELLSNDAQNIDAGQVYTNILTILPFIAIIALLVTIMFVFFLPRYFGYPLVVGALALLANFAPQIVNLLWGRGDDAVTAGAELFLPEQISELPVSSPSKSLHLRG